MVRAPRLMIITIDTKNIEDANAFGELMREQIFDHSKGYGCYSTFDLNEGYEELDDPVSTLSPKEFEVFYGDPDPDFAADWQNRTCGVTNGLVYGYWYWDGDGVLLVRCEGIAAINHDCKKDYYWEWV